MAGEDNNETRALFTVQCDSGGSAERSATSQNVLSDAEKAHAADGAHAVRRGYREIIGKREEANLSLLRTVPIGTKNIDAKSQTRPAETGRTQRADRWATTILGVRILGLPIENYGTHGV